MSSINKRYDFALLFDVVNGNPNGDPDQGNSPRSDPESGRGIVTDVCLKRKIRDYVILTCSGKQYYDIWVKSKSLTLNEQVERAYDECEEVKKALDEWSAWQKDKKKSSKPKRHYEDVARDWMCKQFFDIRTFGAVMSTSDKGDEENSSKLKKTAGQVRGPVQITFSTSVDPIFAQEYSITVCAARKADKPAEKQIGIQGRKSIVPYGLYVAHGFVSPHLAADTGFSEDDLKLLWQALTMMFEHDRSAARGLMASRKLVVFEHESSLGNAPAHSLFDRVKIARKDETKPLRAYSDYAVSIDRSGLPSGITIHEML